MNKISKNSKVKIIDQRPFWKNKTGIIISNISNSEDLEQYVKVKVAITDNKNVIETFLLSDLELLESGKEDTLECLNESMDIKIKQMDEYIQRAFGSKYPGDGCIFIAPNGNFINIYPALDDHEDLCYWLEENGFEENPEDSKWFVDEFNYIRCRNSLHLCFIDLPPSITAKQLYSLEEWCETKVMSDTLDIGTSDEQCKNYNLDDYFPEDIIKVIKRFYSSGILYENKSSNSNRLAESTNKKPKDIIKQYLIVSDFDDTQSESWFFVSKIAAAENLESSDIISIAKKLNYPVFRIKTQIKEILIVGSKDTTEAAIEDEYGRFLLGYIQTERI